MSVTVHTFDEDGRLVESVDERGDAGVDRRDRRDDRLRAARAALAQVAQSGGTLTAAQLSNAVRVLARVLLAIIGDRFDDPDETGEA